VIHGGTVRCSYDSQTEAAGRNLGRIAGDTSPAAPSQRQPVRPIAYLRNYALVIFFVILAGGVILRPGHPTSSASMPDKTEAPARG
jgi:hypothetical protein